LGATFLHSAKSCALIFTNNGLGHILGDFFPQTPPATLILFAGMQQTHV
jgi:hypothetical protein